MDGSSQTRTKTVILLLVCVLFSIALAYVLTKQSTVLVKSDYFARWYATRKLVMENHSLYDPQNGIDIDILNGLPDNQIEGNFFYPAYVALLIIPLIWIPFSQAHFVWLVFIQSLFIAGLCLLAKIEKWPESPNKLAIYLLLTLLFIPNLQNTIWGQFNTLSVISLVLVYLCLRKEHYFFAGICALGLTVKPQAMLLVILFLVTWALSERRRWPFILSFGLAGVAIWALTEWIEPNWVGSFMAWLRIYQDTFHPQGVLMGIGPIGAGLNILLLILSLAMILWNRSTSPDSSSFAGMLVFCLCVWWIVGGVMGMMNLVALPMALIWLFAHLEKIQPSLYRLALVAYSVLYIAGLAGFIFGLSRPELYGLHIQLSELAYKIVAPILTMLLTIPLLFAGKTSFRSKILQHKEAI
jgi:hypothetical protein